jgi:hypothetical protein
MVVGSTGAMILGMSVQVIVCCGEDVVLRDNGMTITPASWGIVLYPGRTRRCQVFCLLSAYLVNKKIVFYGNVGKRDGDGKPRPVQCLLFLLYHIFRELSSVFMPKKVLFFRFWLLILYSHGTAFLFHKSSV